MAFTLEKDKFILEAYYRSGHPVKGEYQYSLRQCAEDFRAQFPETMMEDKNLLQHIRRIVKRFSETGRVGKGKSSGRPGKLTPKTLEDLSELLQESPEQSIRQLSRITGLSTGTCQKAVNVMHGLETRNPRQEETVERGQIKKEPCSLDVEQEFATEEKVRNLLQEEIVQIKEEPCSLHVEEEFATEEKVSEAELMGFQECVITKMRGLSKVDGVKLMQEFQEMITKARSPRLLANPRGEPA